MSNYPQPGYPPGHPAPGFPQDGYPQQPPSSGCGGCLGKFLIFLGVIFLLMVALCCGGFFYMKSYIASSISQQPAEVQKISDEIISIQIPPPLEPLAGGRFQVPFVGKTLGQGAFYSDKQHKGFLILASFGEAFGPQFKDSFLQGLQSGQYKNQSANNDKSEALKDVKKTHFERPIQGEKAVFEITEGTGEQSNKKKIRVQGAFKGKTGPGIFVLDAEEETLSRDKVEKMIDSME